jgi:hypothetical protein
LSAISASCLACALVLWGLPQLFYHNCTEKKATKEKNYRCPDKGKDLRACASQVCKMLVDL